jgi:hypothetical protein
MTEIVLRPLADAFMQVGVFVALLIAPFGWARYRWGRHLDALLMRHRELAPFLAAALTMPPGCGGAIIVVALYARGAVSYGAAIAALVATMGDATWILLAADPLMTLDLKVLMLLAGTVSGYLVDGLGIAPKLRHQRAENDGESGLAASRSQYAAPSEGVLRLSTVDRPWSAAVTSDGALVARPAPSVRVGVLPTTIWITLAVAATVAVPVTFRVFDPAAVGHALLGGVDPYLALGLVGMIVCVATFVAGGCRLAGDRSAHPSSFAEVLKQGGHEVAFITVWVSVAYLVWSVLSHVTGFDGSQLPLFGLAGVLVGALIGLIPGCGVQIVFAGIFVAGGMPQATLVANSLSQDGDALLPMLALEPRSALLATVLTTIPAIFVGLMVLIVT